MTDELKDNGIEVESRFLKVRGSGLVALMMILTAMIIGSMFYVAMQMQQEHRAIVQQTQSIVASMNDIFLAIMLTPEQKANLPPVVRERVEEKVKLKALKEIERDR